MQRIKKNVPFFLLLAILTLGGVRSVSAATGWCYQGVSDASRKCYSTGADCIIGGGTAVLCSLTTMNKDEPILTVVPPASGGPLVDADGNTIQAGTGGGTGGDSGYQLLAPLPTITNPDGTEKTTGITLVEYMKGLFVATIGLAIVLAVIELVVGGIEYVAAAVPSSKEDAKRRIGGAVGGLLLILLAYVLLKALNPALLNVGLNLEKVAVTGQGGGGSAVGGGGVAGGGVGGGGVGGGNFGQVYTNVSTKYAAQIQTACDQQGAAIPDCRSVVAGVIAAESSGNPSVTSPAGALGIMQLLPANGGANCSTDACIQGQINTGVAQLSKGYLTFGSVPNMLASYNGGGSTIDGTSPNGKRPAMATSSDCPGLLAWQCDINAGGLSETKKYVTKICGVVTGC